MERLTAAAVLKECCRGLYPHNREALDALHQLFELAELPLSGTDSAFADAVADTQGWSFPRRSMVEFDYNMATGAGKTRLALRAIQYLAQTGQSSTFVILSHRRILRDRWLSEFTEEVRSSIGADAPVIVASCGQEMGAYRSLSGDILVVVQTLQTLGNPTGGWADTLAGERLDQILMGRSDLVAIVDESHHLGDPDAASEWRGIVESYAPRMLIGLTATPRVRSRPQIFEYSLARMLHEGAYSKSVSVVHRQVPAKSNPTEAVEIATREAFAIRIRLQEWTDGLEEDHPLRAAGWRPKVLFACKTRAEVRRTRDFLVNELRVPETSVLQVTGDRNDDALLEQLIGIDSDPNVDFIVSAYMLDEGWDVTSVCVVCPLRELASPTNAKQLVGRGLRLPQGRRMGASELENLSVISVGQKSLVELRAEVTEVFSMAANINGGPAICTNTSVPGEGVFERKVTRNVDLGLRLLRLTPFDAICEEWALPGLMDDGSDRVIEVDVASQSVRIRDAASGATTGRISSVRHLLNRMPLLSAAQATDIAAVLEDSFGPNWRLEGAAAGALEQAILMNLSFTWADTGERFSIASPEVLVRSKEDPALLCDQNKGYTPRIAWYSGFTKSVFDQGKFDVRPEFELAKLLDASGAVKWWLRNDPKIIRVQTVTGVHSPDFVIGANGGIYLAELKGAQFRTDFDLDLGRRETLQSWCKAQSESLGIQVTYRVFDAAELDSVLLSLES